MVDQYGRKITYLRLSVTERCNLKCIYCTPGSKEHCTLLTTQEIDRIVRAFVQLGIRKVRITGGEPLVRSDIVTIVQNISALGSVEDIPMTTNGILLPGCVKQLKEAGLTRLNISLDTLRPDRFEKITGFDRLDDVLQGVKLALENHIPIKINAVLVRGINDGEIDDLIGLTRDMPIHVRFIELMPIGAFGENNKDKVVTGDEILIRRPDLIPLPERESGGVARMFYVKGYLGKVGLISPMSHQFCHDCNRMRVTSDGKLRPCLGNNGAVDLLPIVREGSDEQLLEAIEKAIYQKPKGHHFLEGEFQSDRNMNRIGG